MISPTFPSTGVSPLPDMTLEECYAHFANKRVIRRLPVQARGTLLSLFVDLWAIMPSGHDRDRMSLVIDRFRDAD